MGTEKGLANLGYLNASPRIPHPEYTKKMILTTKMKKLGDLIHKVACSLMRFYIF